MEAYTDPGLPFVAFVWTFSDTCDAYIYVFKYRCVYRLLRTKFRCFNRRVEASQREITLARIGGHVESRVAVIQYNHHARVIKVANYNQSAVE